MYVCPEAKEKCPVSILDKYLSKLPKDAFEKDLFYVRPLSVMPTNSDFLGTLQFLLEEIHYTRSLMTCVLEQESRERKQTTASEPPVQHRCTKVESPKGHSGEDWPLLSRSLTVLRTYKRSTTSSCFIGPCGSQHY